MSVAATLEIATSPHVVSGRSVEGLMRDVVYALLPTAAFGVYAFGLCAAATLAVAVLSCVGAEHLLCRWTRRDSTVGDFSVLITGLLYGLTLPPALPLWMVAVGGVFGVVVAKFLFGGLGYNAFNPALVGRAFAQAAFPVAMTNWTPSFGADRFFGLPASSLAVPFAEPGTGALAILGRSYDAVSGPTPLSAWKFSQETTANVDLAAGFITGSVGETCSLLILAGGIFLVARRVMSWRIPLAIFCAVSLLSGCLWLANSARYPSPVFMLLSGGLMLGAVFMATDMVASPMTPLGLWIYGSVIGVLVVVIRVWGGMPEGVMYAILFANALSPLIDRVIRPTVYGTVANRRAAKGASP